MRNRLETGMNGRLKRNGNGKNLSGNRGQTRFYSSNESRGSIVRTLTFRCPRAFESVPRIASAPLEDRTGESHVAEAGVPVEMMKIESDPNFQNWLKQGNRQCP